ncbi:MAG: DUF934 domain-containing protein [Aquabacterium sp.]
MQLINPGQDPWHHKCGEDGPQPHPPATSHALLTLEQWHAVRGPWPAGLAVGVELSNQVDVETLAGDLQRLQLVVLNFPKWTDGRAYTQARLLRSRQRFGGEVRAAGDVVVDMLPLLARCGFSSAMLRADQRRDTALRSLGFIDAHYQGDLLQTQPLFRRAVA